MKKLVLFLKALSWRYIALAALAFLAIAFVVGKYNEYQANRIYKQGQAASLGDFSFKIIKSDKSDVKLPLRAEKLSETGGLDNIEDCAAISATTLETIESYITALDSPKDQCQQRNDAKAAIKAYQSASRRIELTYEIKAKGTFKTDDIKIDLLTGSGAVPTGDVSELNDNLFLEAGATGSKYMPLVRYQPYAFEQPKGELHKGLTKTGSIITDVKDSDTSIDVKVSYKLGKKLESRIIRVSL